jgi:hypothetical protein
MIDVVNPGHSLTTIPELPTEEETRGKRHQREQATLSSQDHGISRDHTSNAKLLDRLCDILPGDGELREEVFGWRGRFIGNVFASQAITIDPRGLKENARAMGSFLDRGSQRTSGKDA